MLVLSRKEQESIAIGDDIKLTVISCNKGRMRIGIEAPKETRIVRSELKEKDQQNGK
jgi:carbon storage regulator